MEALTKFALNSTLGTDKFEPLDKIITSGYTLVPSDTGILRVLFTGRLGRTETHTSNVTFKLNGQVKIKCTNNRSSSSSSSDYYTITIKSNNQTVKTQRYEDTTTEEIFSLAFDVVAGVEYEIVVYCHSANNITDIVIGGSTVGGRVFEVIE